MTQQREFTITVTVEEINFIGAGLQELPARICNPLTKKLQDQVNAQRAQQADEQLAKESPQE